jgi:serine/threonine protein kinase
LEKKNQTLEDDLDDFMKDEEEFMEDEVELKKDEPKVERIEESELINTGTSLGKGFSGSVMLGNYKNQQVAIKNFKSSQYSQKEKEILEKLDHHNIVKMIGYVESEQQIQTIVFEKLDEDLHKYGRKNLSNKERIDLCLEISKGLLYLHDKTILHGDIKPENFMISLATKRVVVADFGYSSQLKNFGDEIEFKKGTLLYVAPEIITNFKATLASDVFSFAITMSFLLTGNYPYREHGFTKDSLQIATSVAFDDLRPSLPNEMDISLKQLLIACWSSNPLGRPSIKYIFNFFLNYKFD